MNRILEKIQKLSRLSEGKIYYSDIKYISLFAIIVFIAAICILFCVHKFYFKQKENFIHKNRVILFIAGITVLFSVSVYAYYYGEEAKGWIIINEICGDSTYIGYVDGVRYADYVELYNNGALYFRTAALYLSDSELEPQKYFIQNVELAPYEHRLIPVVDDDFKIKKTKSQNILLYDEKGREIDSVTTIPIKDGYSYGREIDGSSVWHSMRQTPGERNDLYTYDVKAPVFSKKSGFYDEDFLLEMHADDGCDIYYTLDGSIPDESSIHYENPINVYDKSDEPNIYRSIQSVMIYWTEYNPDPIKPPVDKAFVVRAVAIDKDGNKSEAVTSTYFVDKSEYKDEFVISLVAAPEDLFGEHGIYVTGAEYDDWLLNDGEDAAPAMNYAQWGINWEIPASVEFFGLKNEFEQKAGLRLNGSGSRFRTLKNFSVIARKYFGGNTIFDEEIFEGVKTHKILLRYGYINSLAQYLLRDRNISTQRVKRAHVFLDGEYWYTTNCMEKYDETYYSEHYGVNKDNLIICEDGQLEDEKYQEQYDELLEFIENEDMSSEKNYERLAQIVDIQSYIDFMCANIYLDNMDISDEKNAAIWRTVSNTGTGYSDGRWRWSIFDLDAMEWNDFSDFGVGSQAEKNTFKLTQKYVGDPIDELDIFKSLMRNDTFKRSFVNTFMDLMNENFKYENVLMKMEEYPYYESEYMDNPGLEYYTDFFRDRPAFMKKYIKEELELKGETCNITIALDNPVGGQIIINSVTPDISSGMWRGEYYTDYPIQITAVPCEGYEFEGWNIEGNEIYDVSAEIYLESGENTVYGRFVKK